MSRGHGTWQQMLLGHDYGRPTPVRDVITDLLGTEEATVAQVNAVKRAARRLADEGLMRITYDDFDNGKLMMLQSVADMHFKTLAELERDPLAPEQIRGFYVGEGEARRVVHGRKGYQLYLGDRESRRAVAVEWLASHGYRVED